MEGYALQMLLVGVIPCSCMTSHTCIACVLSVTPLAQNGQRSWDYTALPRHPLEEPLHEVR